MARSTRIYRISPRAALLVIDERPVLFSETAQQLYDLNDSAAYVAARLEQGVTLDDLVGDFVAGGLAPEPARRQVRDMLLQWSRDDIVTADMPPLPDAGSRRWSIAVAGLTIGIACANEDLERLIRPVFQHLEGGEGVVSATWEVVPADDCVLIAQDREPALVVRPNEAVPALKALLFQYAIDHADALAALHTALLVRDGRAMLLAGPPGAGKSTLTVALAARGFGYGGDDVSLLCRDGRVHGVPFAATTKPGSWELLAGWNPSAGNAPVHRRLDDIDVRYLPPTPAIHRGPLPIGWLIVLRREAGCPATLSPLDERAALAALFEEALSSTGSASIECVRALTEAISEARAFDLRYSSLEDAVSALKGLTDHD